MDPTPFGEILGEVVQKIPGALGAIFVDWEGEAVDMTPPHHQALALELMGAHWSIIYYQARAALARAHQEAPREVMLRFGRQLIVIRRITDDYLAILALDRPTHLARAMELMRRASAELRREM